MFKCSVTSKSSEPGEKLTKIVTKTRQKTYKELRTVKTEDGRYVKDSYGKPLMEEVTVGSGVEIVQEINVSSEGLKRLNLAPNTDG